MGLLDAITGSGALGMLPGGNVLMVISKGLDLIKDLIEQGNTKGADAVLKFLNDVVQESGKDASSAAEPQPFTPPQGQGFNLEISFRPQSPLVSHGGLPTVDGSARGDQMLSDAARPFVEGSDASKARALSPGSNEWTTVMWAMQQNPNVQYNADTQRFFTQSADGSKMDVCSLADAQSVIEQNGGFDRGNPTGAAALGDFLKDKVGDAHSQPMTASIVMDLARSSFGGAEDTATVDDLQRKIEELKKKLQVLEAAQQVMQPASANITVTVAS
jgi:hypothetical protein